MAGLPLGSKVPNLIVDSQVGKIHLHEFLAGSWSVIFSTNPDFDASATTELGMVAKLAAEFESRNALLLAVSMDNSSRHTSWRDAVNETQTTAVKFPIIADEDGTALLELGMRYKGRGGEPGHVLPCLLIVNPDLKVQFSMTYSSTTGRNFYEVLRTLDSLQLTRLYQVATPAHWVAGDNCYVLSHMSDEEAAKSFPRGVTKLPPKAPGLPACRLTPYPGPQDASSASGAGGGAGAM